MLNKADMHTFACGMVHPAFKLCFSTVYYSMVLKVKENGEQFVVQGLHK